MADTDDLVHLVHPDSNVLLTMYDILSAAGYRVAASSDAPAALAFVARSKPRAILCLWEMPGPGEVELLRRLKRVSPLSRVVMCSPHASSALYDEVIRAGADDLLREPLNPLAVLHAVSRMLGRGIPYLAAGTTAPADPQGGAPGDPGGRDS